MKDLTKDGTSKQMSVWMDFAKNKGSNNEELLQEYFRIKVIEVKTTKEIVNTNKEDDEILNS